MVRHLARVCAAAFAPEADVGCKLFDLCFGITTALSRPDGRHRLSWLRGKGGRAGNVAYDHVPTFGWWRISIASMGWAA